MSHPAYEQLIDHARRYELLTSTAYLLMWDQETQMPRGGAAVEYRSRQCAQLARMTHELRTDSRIDDWLDACEDEAALTDDPLSPEAVNLREIRRDFDRLTKLPGDLVEALSRAGSMAKSAWAQAKRDNDFAAFEPHLAKMIDLSRRKAECFGWADDGEAWDALADVYEPGFTAQHAKAVFEPLRGPLVELVDELMASDVQPGDYLNETDVPIDQQRAFVQHVVQCVGLDTTRSRIDESAHPFCIPINRDDVRLTTRFARNMLNDALGSTLHETGHAIYNQNVPAAQHVGTPFGNAIRLSIHESQSRLVENHLGRSLGFWQWCTPRIHEFFGTRFAGYTAEDLYRSANRVQRSLIRVEADEATYNLHIIIRFELERAMIAGNLSAGDLPAAWAEKYREYLGIDVPDDARGCLQDIHWSQGAFGYFPTYTLGNLYAAQFYEAAADELGDLDAQFAAGDFKPLVDWLTRNIHCHGMRYPAEALCEHVTGQSISSEPLINHLRSKLRPIYGL